MGPGDNDGLFTSIPAVAEALRYGATGDPAAKALAFGFFEGLETLYNVTGKAGLVARCALAGSCLVDSVRRAERQVESDAVDHHRTQQAAAIACSGGAARLLIGGGGGEVYSWLLRLHVEQLKFLKV